MNNAVARTNMIKQQIRTVDVLDESLLEVFAATPREIFVQSAYYDVAYADGQLPLGHGEVMMAPCVEARLLQALALKPTDRVLEIGTGSGYLTALMAQQCQQVVSVDIHPDFIVQARQALAQLNCHNVVLEEGNAAQGWDKYQPYDCICVTGSLPMVPATMRQQLNVGGKLFTVIGAGIYQQAMLFTRASTHAWTEKMLFATEVPPLRYLTSTAHFDF